MSRHMSTMSPELFEGYYATEEDPWHFATSEYERAKYAATIASLPKPRYRDVFEVGCSIGLMSRMLAERADSVLGVDVVESALETARRNCAGLPNVRFELGVVPRDWPEGRFDLIMLSEVICFFDRADLARLVAHVEGSLQPGGDVLVVNWLGQTNFPLHGDEASDGFIAGSSHFLQLGHQERTEKYRLDVLTRR